MPVTRTLVSDLFFAASFAAFLFLVFQYPAEVMAFAASLTRPATRFWDFYCKSLDRRPLISRCLTGLVGGVISDVTAQKSANMLDRQKGKHAKPYDYARTARLVTYGFFVATPLAWKWFDFLDTRIMPHNPKSPKAVITKIVLDQCIMAPLGTMLFFLGIRTLEGRPEAGPTMIREKFIPMMKAGYCLWPAVHVVNFGFVPASQRILFMNVVSIIWGAWCAHFAMSDSHEQPTSTGKLPAKTSTNAPFAYASSAGLSGRSRSGPFKEKDEL